MDANLRTAAGTCLCAAALAVAWALASSVARAARDGGAATLADGSSATTSDAPPRRPAEGYALGDSEGLRGRRARTSAIDEKGIEAAATPRSDRADLLDLRGRRLSFAILKLLLSGDAGMHALESSLADADLDARVAALRPERASGDTREDAAYAARFARTSRTASLRAFGLRALAAWAPPAEVERAAVDSAGDASPVVRSVAVDALAESGGDGPAVLLALERSTRDESADVRARAVLALGDAGGGAGRLGSLLVALRDPDARVREAAARALGRRGPEAAEALAALESARSDPDARVAAAASRAASEVRGP